MMWMLNVGKPDNSDKIQTAILSATCDIADISNKQAQARPGLELWSHDCPKSLKSQPLQSSLRSLTFTGTIQEVKIYPCLLQGTITTYLPAREVRM